MPPYANTKTSSAGTSTRFRREIPFVPRTTTAAERTRPPSESSGERDGSKASSPASIAAHGNSEHSVMSVRIHGAPLPNSDLSAPSYPPCLFPSRKKSAHIMQNSAEETKTGIA